MKDAAKCDTQCELQNSVNHRTFERKWHFQLPAGSTLPPVAPPSTSGATSRVALRTVVAAGGLFYSPTPAPTQGSSAAGRLRAGAGSPLTGCVCSRPTCYLDIRLSTVVGSTRSYRLCGAERAAVEFVRRSCASNPLAWGGRVLYGSRFPSLPKHTAME